MLEVICFHCGQAVQISPDAERCSVCGMNLRKLISREQASGYFYDRAAAMAAGGDVLGALQEVQRGLSYVPTSELDLLGAILCKRLGRLEEMRHYVAAIPVDDPLRGEGEWLLRSNQARQRATPTEQRKGSNKAPVALPIIPDSDALPMMLDEVKPSANHPKSGKKERNPLQPVLWLVVLAALVGAGWFIWQQQPGTLAEWLPASGVASSNAQPEAANAENPAAATIEPVRSTLPAEPSPTALPAQSTAPSSLTFPTPTIAPNLAESDAVSPAIAANNPLIAISAVDPGKLDWKAYLLAKGRADLADLPVTVRVEGSKLIFEGTVPLAEQRAAIAFEAKQVPGVTDVSVVNVKLRTPETYTVRDGDTLWDISVRIYGTPDQIEELFAANQDQMASASALAVGMVLKVPKAE